MQLLQRGPAVRSPIAWVWRASFRIAAGDLKDRRNVPPRTSSPTSYEMPERAEELIRALAALSPSQRAAIILHHYGGYPVKEVATLIGSTVAAVRVHLSVGRKRLRGLLENADE